MTRLVVRGLVAGYEPGLPIVRGADLTLAGGEILVLLGPNGAGKSTLAKAVAGLVRVEAGTLTLDGASLLEVPAHARIRHGLAFVPQTQNVFAALTVAENLAIAAAILPRAARTARIGAMLDLFPDLAAARGGAAGRLSGGQRQMLAVARALVTAPAVLALDEPSAGLSPKLVATVLAKLRAIAAGGVAVLLVEQNARAALAVADRAAILVEGRVAHEGSGASLLDDPTVTALYLGGASMTGQILIDGITSGAMIGLGAIGLTLTYGLLRFANFAHGEFATWGAYVAMVVAGAFGGAAPIGALTFGWPLIAALVVAMALTALLALALDAALFRRLRRHGNAIVLVIASFGASLALRSAIEFGFGPEPYYYTHDIAMTLRLAPGMRATADQLVVLAAALVLMLAMHLLLTRTPLGRAMRAVSENPDLARLAGIDPARIVRATWLIGGALAASAGVFLGVTVQVRPGMGFELLLPLFAAAILGGIGSVPGAMVGGLVIGIAEAAAVPIAGAQYRAAVAFVVLLGMLLVRPRGLFGVRE